MLDAALRAVRALALPNGLQRTFFAMGIAIELLILAHMLGLVPRAANSCAELRAVPAPEEPSVLIEEARYVGL